MEGIRKSTWLTMAVLLLTAGTASAGGFSIYEQGARATALGGAFTATADDGSAIFYNPAGLGYLEGWTVDVNVSPIFPSSKFAGANPPTPAATGETKSQTFPIPGIYVSYTMPKGWAFGVGAFAPFGLGVAWEDPETWIGRTSSYDVSLETVYVSPTVAYKINDKWSVSLAADIAHQKIDLKQFSVIEYGGNSELLNVIDAELEGTGDLNVTPAGGVLFRPAEAWSFGLMYRYKKTFKYPDGTGTLNNVVDPNLAGGAVRDLVDQQIAAFGGSSQKVTTELNLPSILALAARYRFSERFALELDGVYWTWSEFQELNLVFSDDPDSPLSQVIKEEYKDRWQIRLGLDIDISEGWKGMLGYVFDKTPQPVESMGPLLADATRHDFSLGGQYHLKKWKFTLAYMAVLFNTRSTVEDGQVTYFSGSDEEEIATRTLEAGTYDSIANILSIGVGYGF